MSDRFTDFIFDRDVFTSYRIELEADACAFAYWHGQVLHSDFLEISGLAGCLGIVCIGTHPTLEPLSNEPIRQSARQRTSIPGIVKSVFQGNSAIRNSNTRQSIQSSHPGNRINNNESRTSTHRRILSHAAFMLHDMSKGHFFAKNKLTNIFKNYPDKKSLRIFYYCTTNFGQLDWLIKERGIENIQSYGGAPDPVENYKTFGFCSMLASPSRSVRTTEFKTGVKSKYGQLQRKKLSAVDGMEIIKNDGKLKDWDWLVNQNLKTLTLATEGRHEKTNCEICKRKFTSFLGFKKMVLGRHHCRACAKSVCERCCTDLNTLRRDNRMNFIADDGLKSYICNDCNTMRW